MYRRQRGFSLLEMALALGVSGAVMTGLWQMMMASTTASSARQVAGQTLVIAQAAQAYINSQKDSILTVLTSDGDTVCIKIEATDSCATSLTALKDTGLLPPTFVSQNSFGQTYGFYVRRKDSGTFTRIEGLVTSTGGSTISDTTGAQIAGTLGAAGGFVYSGDVARGTGGGWEETLTSSFGGTPGTGHVAVLTSLLANSFNLGGGGVGGGSASVDALSDGKTDNYAKFNLYMGSGVGNTNTDGERNTAIGQMSMQAILDGKDNTAFGAYAATLLDAGSYNTGLGSGALTSLTSSNGNTASGGGSLMSQSSNVAADDTGNTAIGDSALYNNTAGIHNTAVGFLAGSNVFTQNDNTIIGSVAQGTPSTTTGSDNTAIGNENMNYVGGERNTTVGSLSMEGGALATVSDNTAFGASTLRINVTNNNTAFGNRALAAHNSTSYTDPFSGNTVTDGYNTAFGDMAISKLTIGGYNVAFGKNAMSSPDGFPSALTGLSPYNVAVGSFSLALPQGIDATVGQVGIGALSINYPRISTTGLTAIGANTLTRTYNQTNTAMGSYALSDNTSGSANTAFGYYALKANVTGAYNSAFGHLAMYQSKSPGEMVAFGSGTLQTITTSMLADGAVAIGYNALKGLTSGARNTAIGSNALASLTTGSDNTAIGTDAGKSISTNSNNTIIGTYAFTRGAGGNNTLLGTEVFNTTSTASDNTIIGYKVGSTAFTATNNVVIGNYAMHETTAETHNNVIIGHEAFYKAPTNTNTSGTVAIGYQTLYNLGTGISNTVMGYKAGYNATNASFMAVAGYLAGGSTNSSALGAEALAKVQDAGTDNTAVGYRAAYNTTTGQYNTAYGALAMSTNTVGSYNTVIGCNMVAGCGSVADVGANNLTNATAIGTIVNNSNEIVIGNSAITTIAGQVAWSNPSDRRDKHDITDSDLGLEFVKALRPVSFRLNKGNERLDYGFIAQEIEPLLGDRQTNILRIDNDAKHTYSLRATDLIAPIVEAVQSHDAALQHELTRLAKLESEMKLLTERRQKLLALISANHRQITTLEKQP